MVDSNPRRAGPDVLRGGARPSAQSANSVPQYPARGYGDSLYTDVFNSQRIDFGFLETQQNNKNLQDPLPDSVYEPAHKRAERLERSIRNSEKGRAQHEKDQVIRLLEGLQGHDWLRVMGVSGITESKKKSFEPARAYFIKGSLAILEKFRTWNLEEKKRKQERERALAAEQMAALAQQEEEGEGEGEEGGEEEDEDGSQAQDENMEDAQEGKGEEIADSDAEEAQSASAGHDQNMDDSEIVTSQSDTSDVSPAKQLQQEALARSQLLAANAQKSRSSVRSTPSMTSETPKQLTSFFSKKHERDNALHRSRRTGRKVFAWGHAIPDIEDADFSLPEDFLDEEALKTRARKKRRDKRNSRP